MGNVAEVAAQHEGEAVDEDYRRNYLEALRGELVDIVQDKLSPLELKYMFDLTSAFSV